MFDDKPSLDEVIAHYGVGKMDGAPGRGSGRYPLGSGENPYQRGDDLLARYEALEKKTLLKRWALALQSCVFNFPTPRVCAVCSRCLRPRSSATKESL